MNILNLFELHEKTLFSVEKIQFHRELQVSIDIKP